MTVCATLAAPSMAMADGNRGGKPSQRAEPRGRAGDHPKLDRELNSRGTRAGWSRVIITLHGSADASGAVVRLGGKLRRHLPLINGQVVELPTGMLKKLADHPAILRIDHDRPTMGLMKRVSTLTGARTVHRSYGLDGAGIGVAVIDSGVTAWHDDLTYDGTSPEVQTSGSQRVAAFVDFVQGQTTPYDDNGHGTHVSGIIAGNGYDSRGDHAGIAPASHLVSLKVLDRRGRGVISHVIAAFGYAVANQARHNIRVVNLSVGAAVTSSYRTDPLTLAAKRAVDAGIVVVTAAGNLGKNRSGELQWGGILAPGNAPWVLTVGASSHQGTLNRADDTVAPYSSSGPTAIDYAAKPDLVASGTGIVSLSDPTSLFYETKSDYLLGGRVTTAYKPYLSLTGTSMAAPVVSGTVALMLQANPALTPNLVKAILQYTAQVKPDVHPLRQGGGFLNTKGAVELARFFANASPGDRYPRGGGWSRKIHWGSRRLASGAISPSGNAWDLNIVWGTARDTEGDNIVWGTVRDAEGDNIVWGTASTEGDNIVWGTGCGGDDCLNIVWGTALGIEGDNIVWGTSGELSDAVWGTSSADADTTVWGTSGESGELFVDVVDDVIDWESLFALPPPPIDSGGTILGIQIGGL
jgi:serine protease AprX